MGQPQRPVRAACVRPARSTSSMEHEGLAKDAQPEIGKLTKSRLGYFIRDGKHSMIRPDWEVFLEFADEHLKERK